MLDLAQGPNVCVDRGPGWLFIKLRPPADCQCDLTHLADQVWTLAEQHFIYRLVLELDELPVLDSGLIGQLVQLHKRICGHQGVLRLCGLSPENRKVVRVCRQEGRFPHYGNRAEAVWGNRSLQGSRPLQPR